MKQAPEQLLRRVRFGVRPGLDTMQAMMADLGNPEKETAVIHVAGTNGKGSVCAILEAVLRASGFRTGLYTSPNLVHFNERIVIDGVPVSDDDLCDLARTVEEHARAAGARTGREVTFFESATAMAFEAFRRAGVRLAVVEVGLGGRLDATNVVDQPLASVITAIGREHTAWLGNTIGDIAREKAGIIKPGRPVICADQDPEALDVIRQTAVERSAPLVLASQQASVEARSATPRGQTLRLETGTRSYGTLRFPLAGAHQLDNLGVAAATWEVLESVLGIPIDPAVAVKAIESVRWRARCQLLEDDPPVILDAAHNPPAARALAATLKKIYKGRPVGLVVGMCNDKDVERFLAAFSGIAARVWAVPLRSERGLAPSEIARAAFSLGCEVCQSELNPAVQAAREWARAEGGVACLTGSLFLAGEVLDRIEDCEDSPGRQKGEP